VANGSAPDPESGQPLLDLLTVYPYTLAEACRRVRRTRTLRAVMAAWLGGLKRHKLSRGEVQALLREAPRCPGIAAANRPFVHCYLQAVAQAISAVVGVEAPAWAVTPGHVDPSGRMKLARYRLPLLGAPGSLPGNRPLPFRAQLGVRRAVKAFSARGLVGPTGFAFVNLRTSSARKSPTEKRAANRLAQQRCRERRRRNPASSASQ